MTDILVVGAGPAGMSAALLARRKGATVTLVDNRSEPGGNIYAYLNSTRTQRQSVWKSLGSSYHSGQPLVDAFLSSDIRYLPGHSLWHLDPDGTASVKSTQRVLTFGAEKVILATGAQERPMPLAGWTLSGVMGVGAAQILLKAGGGTPPSPVVIIGHGPLPLLYASQVLAVGGEIAAFIEPKQSKKFLNIARNIAGAWHGGPYLLKGLSYLIRRRLARVPIFSNATDIEILGNKRVSGVRFKSGHVREIDANSVLLHDGVVPNVNPGGAAGLDLARNDVQDCWAPVSNGFIKVAGDAAGILGAKSAELTGQAAVYQLMGEAVPVALQRKLAKEQQFRNFIDAVYPTLGNASLASGDAIICRCEAITKTQIENAIPASGTDPNRLKTNLRCGMGPCQGRMCSLSVEAILSNVTGAPKTNVGLHRLRNPIVPITLGSLANAKHADEA